MIGPIKYRSLCLCRPIHIIKCEVSQGKPENVSFLCFFLAKLKRNGVSRSCLVFSYPQSLESVGAFQKLPMVMPSVDILYSALRKAKRVSATKGEANCLLRLSISRI